MVYDVLRSLCYVEGTEGIYNGTDGKKISTAWWIALAQNPEFAYKEEPFNT